MKTKILSALAEPSRLQIVDLLRKESLTVGEIADRLHIRQPQVSKHLRVLHEAGVVEFKAEANRRIYKLRSEPFEALDLWLKEYRDIWEEKFDNLDRYLQDLQESENKKMITKIIGGNTMSTQVKITHTFNATRELVFKAFIESEHLQNWWGPKGWTFNVSKSDFRAGGVFHYSQKPADGDVMWVKFVYSEIIKPKKIVYTSFFSDEEGNIVRAPFNANWPLETLNTMTFIEDEGKTTVTAIVAPVSATKEELKTFRESQDMVHEGFSGTFSQLEDYLSKELK